MDKVMCMLIKSKLPKTLQAETLLIAYFSVNLSPSTAIDFNTPHEIWIGQTTNYGDLKAFDYSAYAHINQGKLAPRVLKRILIGHSVRIKGYQFWYINFNLKKCIISGDAVFNEE